MFSYPLHTQIHCSGVEFGWARAAYPTVLIFAFPSPVRRLDSSQTSGGLGEHCSSSAVRHGLCASPGRVAQPRLLAKYRGNPEGAANRGRLLWVTFLGKTRKVTCCRATPGGFDFASSPFDRLRVSGVFNNSLNHDRDRRRQCRRRPTDKLAQLVTIVE